MTDCFTGGWFIILKTKMVSFNGWLTHCFKLRELEKRCTFLVTSLQGIYSVSRLGAENFIRLLTG